MLNSKENRISNIGYWFKISLFLFGAISYLLVFTAISYAQQNNSKGKKAKEAVKPYSQSELSILRQENLSLIRKVNDLEKVVLRQDKAQSSLRNSVDKLQKENAVLEDGLAKQKKLKTLPASDLRSTVEQLQKENDSLFQKTQSLQKENAALEDGLAKQKKIKDVSPDLKASVGNLEKQNASFAQSNAILSKEKAVLEAMLDSRANDLRQPGSVKPDKKDLEKLIHLNLGFAYGLKGMISEAIAEYQKASQRDPEDKDIHYNLGYLLSKNKKYKPAVEEYKKALKGSSQDREIYYNLAILYAAKLNDQSAAEEYYQKFIEASAVIDPGPRL